MSLPDATFLQHVHLRVADVKQVSAFYTDVLGFQEIKKDDRTALLSPNGQLPSQIILAHHPNATPRDPFAPGLFHTAFRLPTRRALAKSLKRLTTKGWNVQGFADHGVSEAIYLGDPEGNGIELYFDRDPDQWPFRNGQLEMITKSLDVQNLLAELDGSERPGEGIHPETQLGHIHLQVSDLKKAREFYHTILGFDITQESYPGALFLAAGGYHHHIGLNVWNSHGSAPVSGTSAGLISFKIVLPDADALELLRHRLQEKRKPVRQLDRTTFGTNDDDGIVIEVST